MHRHVIPVGVAEYTNYHQSVYTLLRKVSELYKAIKQIAVTN